MSWLQRCQLHEFRNSGGGWKIGPTACDVDVRGFCGMVGSRAGKLMRCGLGGVGVLWRPLEYKLVKGLLRIVSGGWPTGMANGDGR